MLNHIATLRNVSLIYKTWQDCFSTKFKTMYTIPKVTSLPGISGIILHSNPNITKPQQPPQNNNTQLQKNKLYTHITKCSLEAYK